VERTASSATPVERHEDAVVLLVLDLKLRFPDRSDFPARFDRYPSPCITPAPPNMHYQI
jgi:hypothetical protein